MLGVMWPPLSLPPRPEQGSLKDPGDLPSHVASALAQSGMLSKLCAFPAPRGARCPHGQLTVARSGQPRGPCLLPPNAFGAEPETSL